MSQVGGPSQVPAMQAPLVVQQPRVLKVQLPETFEGKPGTLERFLIQLQLYFRFHVDQFSTHIDKILFACTYCRGSAFDWLEGYIQDYLEHSGETNQDRREETDKLMKSYASFEAKLRAIFGDLN